MKVIDADVCVVGSGLAGLSLVLRLSQKFNVVLMTKTQLGDGNSAWAQGGIASVSQSPDQFEFHFQDTFEAGVFLGNKEVIWQVVKAAPSMIEDLNRWGVNFSLDLHLEGGHSHRRIWHVGDYTGSVIQQVLIDKVRHQGNVEIFEEHVLIDVVVSNQLGLPGYPRIIGVWALDKKLQKVVFFRAPVVVLATGGIGRLYRYTTNWAGATGDGIASAFRAGCRVGNMEFIQFHPTLLYHEKSRNFLISEALRGEGGRIINEKGVEFLSQYHPMGALAPRDVVSRGIDAELKKTAAPCVFLDVTHLGADFLKKKFPRIFEHCLSLGIDISVQPIPVVPGAHYACGGVVTDLAGQTDVPGLFVIGESALTGLHGANRLASNSLLECLVMSKWLAQRLNEETFQPIRVNPEPQWPEPPSQPPMDELALVHHLWDEVRTLMWNYVGITRSQSRLTRALRRLKVIHSEVAWYEKHFGLRQEILELRNLVLNAILVVVSALNRKESRGCHYNIDFPNMLPEVKDTIIRPSELWNLYNTVGGVYD